MGYAALVLALIANIAGAQDYPSKPIRLILPQSPGSATDVLARLIAPRMSEALGQPLLIDNRAGAGGIVGAETAAKSPPDGYTVLVGASAWITVSPHTYKKLNYDPLTDLAPVSLFAISQVLLVVNPSLPAGNVRELVALMKAKPDQLNMASAGIGSTSHLAGVLLTSVTDTRALHVPYKGAGGSIGAVVANEAHWTFTPMQGPLAFVRAGRLRALAVGGSSRSSALPDVPTVAESGYPDYELTSWYGWLVPRGTPAAVVDRLHAATVAVMGSAEVREQVMNQG
ncbi:MAG: tripartite tricarboxylate transporter substrate binding protein, partial [Betaproteobacteria bacterium]|nr:tripartite tricarboxylate transporter substrate binding protein [Betaproteobacteria bacterium]